MKKEILNKINSNLFYQENSLKNMYRGKTFLVVRGCGTIDQYYKTRRGAEGYINKNKDWSYYDEYTMELVYPNSNSQVVEIKESELVGFNNWNLWHEELRGYMGTPWLVSSIECYIKYVEDQDLLNYINESIEDIKTGKGLRVPKQLENNVTEEKEEVKEVIEEEITDKKQDINNSVSVEKVVLNEEKNGVEIYFTEKPSEEVRDNLKLNGFRWSKYNKCWYAKQNKDTLNFANSLKNVSEEEIKETSQQYQEEKEKELENKLNDLDINDIESYIIDPGLSKRENSVSMFRSKDTDHTKQIQEYFTNKQNEVLEVLSNCNNKQIEYTLKMALQRFKRDYHTNYIKQLQHRALNPSWIVTGRSGRDIRRDEKMNNRYDKLLKESLEITNKFDKAISKAKKDIKQQEKEAVKKHFEDNTKDITIPKFKRVKKSYSVMATNNIFANSGNVIEGTMHEYKDYYIFKNWGSFRVYDSAGNELYNAKTQGTLEDAKKWLIYYLNNKVSEAV